MSENGGTQTNTFQEAISTSGGTSLIASTFNGTVHLGSGRDDPECLRALRLSDPRTDRERIFGRKDRLLEGSCSWIYKDQAFQRWWESKEPQTLWLHGNAGKGKSMLMTALVDEISGRIQRKTDGASAMSYFFCQDTDSNANNAVAILRGLIFVLLDEHSQLRHYLRKRYDHAGPRLFEETNALYSLWAILRDIIQDSSIDTFYLLVDALDECRTDLDDLLGFMSRDDMRVSSKVKWLVSSRNREPIRQRLESGDCHVHTSLEVNANRVAEAVTLYIENKVDVLALNKRYDRKLQSTMKEYLKDHAEGTFLWVALVCAQLAKTKRLGTEKVMRSFPAGLVPLYGRMMEQIMTSEDDSVNEYYESILRAATLAEQPLRLDELLFVANLPRDTFQEPEHLRELVLDCASFLYLQETDDAVYFVHQSAKDYFSTGHGASIFASGQASSHGDIAIHCLDTMMAELKMNMCNLSIPGILVHEVELSRLDQHLRPELRWACLNWTYHIQGAGPSQWRRIGFCDGGRVHVFYLGYFLYWFECLCLMGQTVAGLKGNHSLSLVIRDVGKPKQRLQKSFVDCIKFLKRFERIIEKAPLQIYSSAMIFSPRKSLLRTCFARCIPVWITRSPKTDRKWKSLLYTLEGFPSHFPAIIFSQDSQRIASWSDKLSRIWNATTGQSLDILNHEGQGQYLVFSQDGRKIASAARNGRISLHSTTSGAMLMTFKDNKGSQCYCLAFSQDDHLLAFVDADERVTVLDAQTGVIQHTFKIESLHITMLRFFQDNQQLTCYSGQGAQQTWDMATERMIRATEPISFDTTRLGLIQCSCLSQDGSKIAVALSCGLISVKDTVAGAQIHDIDGRRAFGRLTCQALKFSHNGERLAALCGDDNIRIWHLKTRAFWKGPSEPSYVFALSHDGQQCGIALEDGSIKIWDIKMKGIIAGPVSDIIHTINVSQDGWTIVSGSIDGTTRTWDMITGDLLRTFTGPAHEVNYVNFSPDGRRVASATYSQTRVWDTMTGDLCLLSERERSQVDFVAFSCDSKRIALSRDEDIEIWHIARAARLLVIETDTFNRDRKVFSRDGLLLASASPGLVRIWCAITGTLLNEIAGLKDKGPIRSMTFSPDDNLLAVMAYFGGLQIWDVSTESLIRSSDNVCTAVGKNEWTLQEYLGWRRTSQKLDELPRFDLNREEFWIFLQDKRILYLPADRRPCSFESDYVDGDTIVLGSSDGDVTILRLDRRKLLSMTPDEIVQDFGSLKV